MENRVTAIFDEIPSQLQRHEKRFRLSSLREDARMRNYADAFFWLDDAKIINCCYNTTEPSVGLRLNEARTSVKCYMGDTGLLISHAFDSKNIAVQQLYQKLMFGKLEINQGMLVENVVAQMLRASGHKLFFFGNTNVKDSDSRMEIDFLITKPCVTSRHNIIPIEVKSGANYTIASLRKCVAKYHEQIVQPTVLHSGDLQEVDGILLYLHVYLVQTRLLRSQKK